MTRAPYVRPTSSMERASAGACAGVCFTQECWGMFTTSFRTERRQFQYRPNCRGAGAIIAVWPYVSRGVLT
eukprot:964478-Lingulodinium_polyedra.AAC.1